MTPLRVAVVRKASGAESGGATFEDDLWFAAMRATTMHRLIMYPDSAHTQQFAREQHAGDRITFVPALKEPSLPARGVQRASRTIRREPAPRPFAALGDALVAAGAHCAWMLGASITPLDIPYVATVWDLQHRVQPWFPEVSSNGQWTERERLFPEYIRRAAAVIVGTEVGADEIRVAYGEPAGGLHVLPLPTPSFVLDAALGPIPARLVELPARYLFYPAQFWSHKNHVTALRTLALLAADPEMPHLVLVGADRGTLDHVMRTATALGVQDRLHALGHVDRATLVALYAHAEALLFPSMFGPDNLPPLEAMALGCPVIAARVNGAEEQLGDAAILVDALDAEGFAAAIRALRLDHAHREAMIARGRKRANAWTASQYVSAVFELIERRIEPVRALWP
ncbi:MAG: glycosyltransferase family 1 protein [bacterium]